MSPSRHIISAVLAMVVSVAAPPTVGAAAPAAAHGQPGVTTAAIELGESVPRETALGNPRLRSAHDIWLEMIGGAKQTIDLEGFYLSTWPGEPLDDVLNALGAAAKRGVKVRLLFDRGMSASDPRALDSLGNVPGFALRKIDFKHIAGGVQHSKYFIVDGREVWLGSQNFDWRSLAHIHELGARVRDARIAADFAEVYDWDWAAADTNTWTSRVPPGAPAGTPERKLPAPPAPHTIAAPLRLVQAPGDTAIVWPGYTPRGWIPDSSRWDQTQIVKLIAGARQEVVLQVLTYSPEEYGITDPAIDQALRDAAARGAHVKLLVSDWEVNGRGIGWLQKLATVPNVEARLSNIPPWSGGYIPYARVEHTKYMVVDGDRMWLGTSNWGPGYFLQSRNLGLVIANASLAAAARAVFEASWTAPSASGVTQGQYPEKVRGEKPPEGTAKVYGK